MVRCQLFYWCHQKLMWVQLSYIHFKALNRNVMGVENKKNPRLNDNNHFEVYMYFNRWAVTDAGGWGSTKRTGQVNIWMVSPLKVATWMSELLLSGSDSWARMTASTITPKLPLHCMFQTEHCTHTKITLTAKWGSHSGEKGRLRGQALN